MKRISVVIPIYAPMRFQRDMTVFAIKTLRANATEDFDIVIAEAGGDHFRPEKWAHDPSMRIDKYIHFPQKIGILKELHAAFDLVTTEFIAQGANDVIVPPKWDELFLEPFDRFKLCGISSLSALEPGGCVGPRQPVNLIVEGWYAPMMMFRKHWRMCEDYPSGWYADHDFIMRVYSEGLHAFRHCGAHVMHLNHMTNGSVDKAQHARDLALAEEIFYSRWGNSPLAVYGMLRTGVQIWGREHEAWLNQIPRHQVPVAANA